jgi:hypothetical protein
MERLDFFFGSLLFTDSVAACALGLDGGHLNDLS